MARLNNIGFELNSTTASVEWSAVTSPVGGAVTIGTGTVRTGTYAGRSTLLTSGTRQGFAYQFVSAVANGPYFCRFYVNVATLPSGNNAIAKWSVGAIGNAAAVLLRLTHTGTFQLLQGTSTQIGSDSAAIATGEWHCLEMWVDKSPAAGSQVLKARLDGVEFASSTTATIPQQFLSLILGGNLNVEAQTTGDWWFDDVAINDSTGSAQTSYPGPGAWVHLRPSAAGDNNAWATQTGGTAGSANNYTRVNEVTPDDAATTNADNTTGHIDDYNIDDPTFGAGSTINCVQVGVRYAGGGASSNSSFHLRLKASSGGTLTETVDGTPASTTYLTNANAAPQNPALTSYTTPGTVNAWTKADLTTAQIGVKVGTGAANTAAVSALWLGVDYLPATDITAAFAGAGALAAIGTLTVPQTAVTPTLAGAGALAVSPITVTPVAAQMTGAGALAVTVAAQGGPSGYSLLAGSSSGTCLPRGGARAVVNAGTSGSPTWLVFFNSGTVTNNGVTAQSSTYGTSPADLATQAHIIALPVTAQALRSTLIGSPNGWLVSSSSSGGGYLSETYGGVGSNAWSAGTTTGVTTNGVWSAFTYDSGGTTYYHAFALVTTAATPQVIHYVTTTPGGALAAGYTATYTGTQNTSAEAASSAAPFGGQAVVAWMDLAASTARAIWLDATDALASASPTTTSGAATSVFAAGANASNGSNLQLMNDRADGTGNLWLVWNNATNLIVYGLASSHSATDALASSNWAGPYVAQKPAGGNTGAGDKYATLHGDGAGRVFLFWIDNATNDLNQVELQLSGGTVSAAAPATTVVAGGTNGRAYLSSNRHDASQALLVWREANGAAFAVAAASYTPPASLGGAGAPLLAGSGALAVTVGLQAIKQSITVAIGGAGGLSASSPAFGFFGSLLWPALWTTSFGQNRIAPQIAGAGGLAVTVTPQLVPIGVTAQLAGAGALAATGTVTAIPNAIAVSTAGVGALAVAAGAVLVQIGVTAQLSGAGALVVTGVRTAPQIDAVVQLSGAGVLTAIADVVMPQTATPAQFAGVGTLVVQVAVLGQTPVAAQLGGAGSLVAQADIQAIAVFATAQVAGTGALSVSAQRQVLAISAVSAVGGVGALSVSASAQAIVVSVGAQVSGVGALRVGAAPQMVQIPAPAAFAGAAGLTVSASVRGQVDIAAQASGAGALTVLVAAQVVALPAQAQLGGAAALAVLAAPSVVTVPLLAQVAGAGALDTSVSISQRVQVSASFAGVGALLAAATTQTPTILLGAAFLAAGALGVGAATVVAPAPLPPFGRLILVRPVPSSPQAE